MLYLAFNLVASGIWIIKFSETLDIRHSVKHVLDSFLLAHLNLIKYAASDTMRIGSGSFNLKAISGRIFLLAVLFAPTTWLEAQPQGAAPTQVDANPGPTPKAKEDIELFKTRKDALLKLLHSQPFEVDEFERGARALVKDFPEISGGYWSNGYDDLMIVVEYYEQTEPEKARALAREMADSPAPERFKAWFRGFLNRLDSAGKPVSIQFSALDGRNVGTTNLIGKVVLVDFWATTCSPCVEELPEIKALYEKLHAQGFEVVGISFDTDKARLQTFIQRNGISWPQSFEGFAFEKNSLGQEFGISGIPHMFLLDKKGCLRRDYLHADPELEKLILKLLAE